MVCPQLFQQLMSFWEVIIELMYVELLSNHFTDYFDRL